MACENDQADVLKSARSRLEERFSFTCLWFMSAGLALQASCQSLNDGVSTAHQEMGSNSTPPSQNLSLLSIPLPVFISIEELQQRLETGLFTDNGRFYPCAEDSQCYKQAGDVYLEQPSLSVDNDWLKLVAHVAGHVAGPVFTHPTVSTEVTILGAPVLNGTVLSLEQVQIDTASSSLLIRLRAGRLKQEAETKLEQNFRYDLAPRIEAGRAKIDRNVSSLRGPGCSGIALNQITVRSIRPSANPQGLRVVFNAAVGLTDGQDCK